MSLASNAPLRLPLLTAAEVRAGFGCPICGAEAGTACTRHRGPLRADQEPANHQARIDVARQLRLPDA